MKALKEWASIVCALEEGTQTVLLRKGGIHDTPSGFREECSTFLLFPTYEHQRKEHLEDASIEYDAKSIARAPPDKTIRITSVAKVLCGADVDLNIIDKLSEFHIWSDLFIHERQRWMPQRPMRAIFLKVSTIKPIEIPNMSEYSGCKSWLEINSNPEIISHALDSEIMATKLEKFEDIVS
ncbi:MAG: hypothetical protein K8823_509 [Cenarchaeum symbiont of Oopsacas minuta]|nr:hypothetical protein [Cenarchaeum symbiont of Oopsacas minuta]